MMALAIQIGFGLVVIAMVFLVFVFGRAWLDDGKRTDTRYRVVAMSLLLSCVGVGMWAFNPLLQSFGGPSLPMPGLFLASALILLSACSLVGSTAMGGNRRTLKTFLVTCAFWALLCVTMAALA